jgi:hypothetical protein
VAVEEALDISLQPRYNLNRDLVAVEEALDISLQPRYNHFAMLCGNGGSTCYLGEVSSCPFRSYTRHAHGSGNSE